jgi:hypothetical protein
MPKTKAATAPLQPPVIGRGMATKKIRASSSKISNFRLCLLLVLSKSQLKKERKKEKFLERKREKGSRKSRRKITGSEFPIKAQT